MALTEEQIQQFDQATGLSESRIDEFDQALGIGKSVPEKSKSRGILDKIADVFVGRSRDVVEMATMTPQLDRSVADANQKIDSLFSESQDLIRQAKTTKDQVKKQSLIDQARALSSEIGAIGQTVDESGKQLQETARISEADLERSNLDFAARRGAGVAGEAFALAAPGAKELQSISAAAKTASVLNKMKAAGIVAAPGAFALGVTDEQADGAERVAKGVSNAALSFVTAAAVAGGFEIGKQGLKAGGKLFKSLVPKKAANKVFASAFDIPNRIADRVRPLETADEIGEYGISGSLDDMGEVSRRVTGNNGILTRTTRNALGKIKQPIQVDDAITSAKNQLDISPTIDDNEGKKILRFITKTIKPDTGLEPGQNQALDAFEAIQKLEKQGYFYINKNTKFSSNPKWDEMGDIYLAAADELRSLIDKTSVDERVVEAMKTPGVINALNDISPRLAEKFKAAKSIADLRALQKPFVRLSQMVDITESYATSPLTKNISGAAPVTTKLLNIISQNPTVRTTASRALRKAESTSTPPALQSLFTLLNQAAGRGIVTAPGPIIQEATTRQE